MSGRLNKTRVKVRLIVSHANPFLLKTNPRKTTSRNATSRRKLNNERFIRTGGGIIRIRALTASAMKSGGSAASTSPLVEVENQPVNCLKFTLWKRQLSQSD